MFLTTPRRMTPGLDLLEELATALAALFLDELATETTRFFFSLLILMILKSKVWPTKPLEVLRG
jgi:hypothetical protein